jgi:ribonuclease-3
LDFLVANWVYQRFPEMSEGDLTRMRSALVHTEQLANFARKIDLGRAMRLGRGEIQNGGSDRSALLCDTFEALVGALFLETDFVTVTSFLSTLLEDATNEIMTNFEITDPKSLLQEWAQGKGFEAPKYKTKTTKGPEHRKVFSVDVLIQGKTFGTGEGYSKQSAEKKAAQHALQQLGIL